jgi:hypothetical protein
VSLELPVTLATIDIGIFVGYVALSSLVILKLLSICNDYFNLVTIDIGIFVGYVAFGDFKVIRYL